MYHAWRRSGYHFHSILADGAHCAASQRFGQPRAVNCSVSCAPPTAGLAHASGLAPGLRADAVVHLSLRHKLRAHVLPPLRPVVDLHCGHKAFSAEAQRPQTPPTVHYYYPRRAPSFGALC